MIRASDFLDTIGVNTRLAYVDGDYRSSANVLSSLQYLGVDHVRDHAVWDKWVGQGTYGRLANAGIRFDMVIQTNRSPDDFIQQAAAFDGSHPGSVFALEGPNEIDLFPPTYNGLTGVQAGQAIVNRIAELAAASPLLDDAFVYDLTGANVTDAAGYENVHLYSHNGDQPRTMIGNAVANEAQRDPGKPMVISEIGYHTGVGNTSWEGVDQDTQAKLILNVLLDAEKLGVAETYLFQLFDAYPDPTGTGIDRNMGLFEYGYEPKKAAMALHNFTAILADHGTNAGTFSPTELAYSISNLPGSGDYLTFEKSNGTYDIVIWAEPDIWDQAQDQPIAVPATRSTVAFGGAHYDVRLFDPLVSDQPIAAFGNVTSVDVPVSDHPVILEVTAVGSPKEDLDASASTLVITLLGTAKDDVIDGSAWDNVLKGLGGNDVLSGGGGDDQLYGGYGKDTLDGGPGDDLLVGGLGRDVMTGGGGMDTFRFAKNDSKGTTLGALDVILDWGTSDRVDLPVKGSGANYFEAVASDFTQALDIANAQLTGTVKLGAIGVGADVVIFAELNANHAGYDLAVVLQQTQLSEIGWTNFI